MAIDDRADTLIYSDCPEMVGPNPSEGILYEHDVASGCTRVLYYHVNNSVTTRTFGIRVKNLTGAAIRIRTLEAAPRPSGTWTQTGHACNVAFMRELMTGTRTDVTLAAETDADSSIVLAAIEAGHGRLATAYAEIDQLDAGALRFSVVVARSKDRVTEVAASGNPVPADTLFRSGVFAIGARDVATLDFSAGRPFPSFVHAPRDQGFPNLRIPAGAPIGAVDFATYGVLTHINAHLVNSGTSATNAALYFQAGAGDSTAVLSVDDALFEIASPLSAAKPAKLKSYRLEPGSDATTEVVSIGELTYNVPFKFFLAGDNASPAIGQPGSVLTPIP